MAEETPQEPLSAIAAWTEIMRKVGVVAKDSKNREQGYNFRGVDAVVNTVSPLLREFGVVVVPETMSHTVDEIMIGKNRTPMGHASVLVQYTVYGPDGSFFLGSAPGEAMDSGDKATAKAMSVAWRTFLIQALALPTDERDPDHDTYQRAASESSGQRKDRDWITESDQIGTFDEMRALWNEANAAGADRAILDELYRRAEELRQKEGVTT